MANLIMANLEGADLRRANLIMANLEGANLSGVGEDTWTVWPEGHPQALKQLEEKAETSTPYLEQRGLAAKEAEANVRYMRASDAFDNRDGASSPGDSNSEPDQSDLCPSCGVRVRADGSCLC